MLDDLELRLTAPWRRLEPMAVPDNPGQDDAEELLDRLTYAPDVKRVAYTDELGFDACAHRRDER